MARPMREGGFRPLSLVALILGTQCSRGPAPATNVEPSSSPAPAALSVASAEAPRKRVVQPPLVNLAGEARPAAQAIVAPGAPRLYSRALHTWVYQRPSKDPPRLGYMRAGASSPTAATPAGNASCKGGWYPVEPEGFVCLDERATLDARDPVVRAVEEHGADPGRKLPYIYGT